MDLITAIKGRRSCREYTSDPIDNDTLEQIIEAALWAPSPANFQPWQFIVVTSDEVKQKIFSEAEERRKIMFEMSGWKWLNKYAVDFLKKAPLIICIVGDPKKSGVDMFSPQGPVGYQHACAAAIQNILLTAHSFGLGSLWFTLFDKDAIRSILNIDSEKDPLALICLGKPSGDPMQTPRKDIKEKIIYMK